jgi:hypothetical protein
MKTLQNPAGFRTVFTGSAGINLKQQNRTNHLLQKPDIFSCYRHRRDSWDPVVPFGKTRKHGGVLWKVRRGHVRQLSGFEMRI